ncbi:MAG: hypothetical protein IJZ94_04760 [Clostridia bacterium]|nr:hypothetical protein [Clostridia bacterium]MBQ8165107.1 hypothetical protein [Clostridia bacterium]
MNKSIYIRFALILLSIFTVFTAVPCASETVDTAAAGECLQPEYIEHVSCLPFENIEAVPEEITEDTDGYSESGISLPLALNSSESTILTDKEKAVCQAIYEGLVALSSKVTLPYTVTTDELSSLYKRIIYSSPELFYVNSSYSYSYMTVSGVKYVVAVSPKYKMTSDEVASARTYIDAELQKLLALCDASWTDMEKVLFYHDYLVLNFCYDERLYTQGSSYVNYDIYNFLKEKTGVCMAYQLLMMALLDEVGVENSYAENGGHIWNVVKIDGNWYHVDATWDDPIVNSTDYNGFYGLAEHVSFMKSDTYFTENGYDAWNCDYTCTDTTYDANTVLTDTISAIIIEDEGWYYVDKSTAYLMCYDIDTDTSTSIKRISPSLSTCYSSLYKYGDCLIYNGAYSVFAYNTVTGASYTLNTSSVTSSYILGFTVEGETLDYITGTTFAESSWSHTEVLLCDTAIGRLALISDSILWIDDINKLLENVTGAANTLADIKASLMNSTSNITVKDSQGAEITASSSLVGTGCQIILTINGSVKDTLTIVVDCDTDGDGAVTVADAAAAMSDVYGTEALMGVYGQAADFDENEAVTIIDVMNILNSIA